MLMAKRKTGKKVEFYNWIMYTLSLSRSRDQVQNKKGYM